MPAVVAALDHRDELITNLMQQVDRCEEALKFADEQAVLFARLYEYERHVQGHKLDLKKYRPLQNCWERVIQRLCAKYEGV